MKYIIKSVSENWGTGIAKIELMNENNVIEEYECSIDTISKLAYNIGYKDYYDNILTDWIIDKEINMSLLPINDPNTKMCLN
jgi:hypothetical protein